MRHKRQTHRRGRGRSRQSRRRITRNKRGGKFIGQGAYGTVYGEPRLPCEGESIDAVRDLNEVSKVFETQEQAEPEGELVGRLEGYGWTPADIERLREYAVIPSKLCRVDLTAFEHEPYSNVAWAKDSFVHGNLKRGLLPFQVTSERGEMDVAKYIENHVNNIPGFYKTMVKLLEFGEGIDYILSKDCIHPDLKTPNMVVVNGKFKMIDMADMYNFVEQENPNDMMDVAYFYTPWPSLSILTTGINALYSSYHKDWLYALDSSTWHVQDTYDEPFNQNMIISFLPNFISHLFFISRRLNFPEPSKYRILKYGNLYTRESMFGWGANHGVQILREENVDQVITYLGTKDSDIDRFFRKYIDYYRGIFEENGHKAALRDIYTRIQLHEYGMLFLETMKYFVDQLTALSSVMNAEAFASHQASPEYGRFVEFFEEALSLVMEHLMLQEKYDMKLDEGASVPSVSLGMQPKSLDTLREFRGKMREMFVRYGLMMERVADAGVAGVAGDAGVAGMEEEEEVEEVEEVDAEERPKSLPLSGMSGMSASRASRRRSREAIQELGVPTSQERPKRRRKTRRGRRGRRGKKSLSEES